MKGSFVTCFFTSRLVELELQNVAHKISERKNNITLTARFSYFISVTWGNKPFLSCPKPLFQSEVK